MGSTAPIAEFTGVTKSFNGTTAVDDLSMVVGSGQIFGLIGPSGCGKTTIIRLILGVLAPTSGTVKVLGMEPTRLQPKHRQRIGYTPQGFFLYPTLTVQENINFVAGLFGMGFRHRRQRIRAVLDFLELWEARKRLARDLSGGMQRRLGLGCALVHEPDVLFVDEPTAGLDPVLRLKIWEYLRMLCEEGTTILVTTQYIDETVHCDQVAVLNAGRLLTVGTPDELRKSAIGGEIVEVKAEMLTREDIILLRNLPGIHAVRWTDQESLRLVVEDATFITPVIVQELERQGTHVTAIEPIQPTFDEVFMKIVNDDAQ